MAGTFVVLSNLGQPTTWRAVVGAGVVLSLSGLVILAWVVGVLSWAMSSVPAILGLIVLGLGMATWIAGLLLRTHIRSAQARAERVVPR